MPKEQVIEIILDSLKDSAIVFVFVFFIHVLLAFFDHNISNFLVKRKQTGPVFGALFGLVPQCGTSVLGADLYIRKYISLGTLIAIFLSCSDEAFIALVTSGTDKAWAILPLIALKFSIGLFIGFICDVIFRKQEIEQVEEVEEEEECEIHHHENNKFHKYFMHPLMHSLMIFLYVLVICLALGFLIGFIGEDNFASFMSSNKYLSPLYASIIGLIPNCASSLLITELYVSGHLSFGALLAGLLVNSGLGMMLLLRKRKTAKYVLLIIGICFVVAVVSGYITCLINGF